MIWNKIINKNARGACRYAVGEKCFFLSPFAASAQYGRFYSDLYIILPDFDL